jgi:hypothetical protein
MHVTGVRNQIHQKYPEVRDLQAYPIFTVHCRSAKKQTAVNPQVNGGLSRLGCRNQVIVTTLEWTERA